MKKYVLDACALIAYLTNENGANKIQEILDFAKQNKCEVFMHSINLLEVYYGVRREYGEDAAINMLESIKDECIIICSNASQDIIIEAGRLKSIYKISLADSIGLAQTILLNASFVTSDHHELDIVDVIEDINFTWFR